MFFEGRPLDGLEFLEVVLEFAGELLLGVFLGWLDVISRVDEGYSRCIRTLTSSQDWIFFTPSPTSLKVSFVSSKRSWTRSLTLSVSRFVPSSDISLESREMLPVNVKSLVISSCDRRWNSGSSEYWGSSCRRIVVGCDSKEES